jgi:cytoskeletal protein CcmA (bactofilin family)
MAVNPLKVLVELQAKKGAVISGSAGEGLHVEHDVAIGDELSVAGASTLVGAADLQSTLDVAGQATFADAIAAQNGMTVTGAPIDASAVAVSASALSVSGDGYFGGKLTVQGNLEVLGQLDAISRTDLQVTDTLIVAAKGAANAAAADAGGFKLEGSDAELTYAAIDDSWNMNKKLNLESDLAIAGDESIAGDLSVTGELAVTAAASLASTLDVDGKISGAGDIEIQGVAELHNGLTVDGAQLVASNGAEITGGLTLTDTGLTISGGGATITGGVSATSDISAGGNLEVTGYAEIGSTLDVAGIATFDAAVTASSTLDVAGAASLGGSLDVVGAVALDSTLDVAGAANFAADMQAEALLKVAASGSLSVITAAESAGYYDVAKAIKLLDSNVGDNKTAVIAAYEDLRVQKTGAFSGGQAVINLSVEGAEDMFDAGSIDYIALDVMVKDAAGEWQNDLVAVHMFVDGSDIKVQIDALTEATHYRLLAVNEKAGKFSW